MKFELGRMVATPGALAACAAARIEFPAALFLRHARGDWGVVDEHDRKANEEALTSGARIWSAYLLPNGTKVWVITTAEDDNGIRESTCLLLPDEY